MAPNQVPHQLPWRDAHPSFLLSPLMGLLSRAWSLRLLSHAWNRLRGPGPQESWLVEAVKSEDQGEAGLEVEAKTALATRNAPWGRQPQREAEDLGTTVEDGVSSWVACPALKASSLLEAWEFSDGNDEEYGGEEATSGPKEQGSEYRDGQLAPLAPSLLKTLQDPPGEKDSEEGEAAEDEVITVSFPQLHWECRPGVEEEEDGEAVNEEAPRSSTSSLSPGSMPRALVSCAGEPEAPAKEGERTENKEARKTSVFSPPAGSHPSSWECYAGEEAEGLSTISPASAFLKAWVCLPGEETEEEEEEEEDSDSGAGEEEGEAAVPSSILPASTFLRAWVYRPGEDTENEEEEEGDSDSGVAEEEVGGPSSIPPTSAFLRAWVYRPGEDTEDEEDSDSGVAEGEDEGPSSIPPTSAFLRAWVYRPGEDTEDEEEEEEDSGSGVAEGKDEGPSSMPPTSAFLRAWVYRPGEDTEDEEEEEEDSDSEEAEGPSSITSTSAFLRSWVYRPGEDTEEEDEDEKDGSEAAGPEPGSSIQAQSVFLRGRTHLPGKESEDLKAAQGWEAAEPHPFQVAIYLPGEKPPPPWDPPRLPLRLQRRLKCAETPIQRLDPETPQKASKVRFSEKVSIRFLVVWAGPAQAARRGPWEQHARDRSRFARRIAQAEEVLGPCFTPAARARAWARLRNCPPPLAAVPATTLTLPTSFVQAKTLSHTMVSPFPVSVAVSPCLDLSGRRG